MMSEDILRNSIKEKIKKFGYESAIFKLALVKENDLWKILTSHIILDLSKPKNPKKYLEDTNFVLIDISVSINQFENFLNYLRDVWVGNYAINSGFEIEEKLLFKIGEYPICFLGNFPGRELDFYGRDVASKHHGQDNAIFLANYAIHNSVLASENPKIDLTGHEIPLRDVTEAINHYWGTYYERYGSIKNCNIYLPILNSNIKNISFKNNHLKIKIDSISKNIESENLFLSVIAEDYSRGGFGEDKRKQFRKKFGLKKNIFELDFDFKPTSIEAFLIKNNEKIDEIRYYESQPQATILHNRPRLDVLSDSDEYTENKEENLFDKQLVEKLPEQIQLLLNEAEESFKNQLYRASALLIRGAMEEGITIILRKNGNEENLYNKQKFEIGLQTKINLIVNNVPSFKQAESELLDVKWFGDKASHEAVMPIQRKDILLNLEPKFRLVLAKMVEILESKL